MDQVRVKICCISSVEEAREAIRCGADVLGLVSEMPSGPGVISDDVIAEIVAALPEGVETCLLTSRTDPREIAGQVRSSGVNSVQLCSPLSDDALLELRTLIGDTRLVLVLHIQDETAIELAMGLENHVDAFLLDSGRPDATTARLGGTGRTHDWNISRRIREAVDVPVILAGGLCAENIADAVGEVEPWGVDVCSGVRTDGRLDTEKLAAFFEALNSLRLSRTEQAFRKHIAWTSDTPLGWEIESAEGPFLHLSDGRCVIDLISGIAVSSIGHRHPRVVAAIERQLKRHLHVMVYGEFVLHPQAEFAELLAAQLPDRLGVSYFTMTGTEANEGALKLAKKYTGRRELIAFENSYHGDTHGSLSVTGRSVYRKPFEPLLPDVRFLPFNEIRSLDAISEATACVIAEPIQGEGGIHPARKDWAAALRKRCDDTGALLIFDEIQTGFGRTGSLFAFEWLGVVPDILTLAKAMGAGMPLGAFVSRREIMDTLRRDPALSHVTTFGGHPVSCAAAVEGLRVLLGANLTRRALEIEERIRAGLEHTAVREIRGRGAMLGLDLVDAGFTKRVVERCTERGVLLGWTLHSNTLVRIAPPLNIPFRVLDEAIGTIMFVLEDTSPA
jgi:acetylornithine/N-succinyldiaminopimelate aminotransferase